MQPRQIANLITEDPDEYTGLEDQDKFREAHVWVQELQAVADQDDPLIVFISHQDGDKIIFGNPSSLRKLYGFVNEFASLEHVSHWLQHSDTYAYEGNGPEFLHIDLADVIL